MDVKSKKTRQSERTRKALLRVATRLFAERGYEATRLEDVAGGVRVTKGALYHQFRDKRDLFEAVFEDRVSELTRTAKSESKAHTERLGISAKAPARYQAGLDILIDSLCDPASRAILLVEGPAVLGRTRWQEVWGARMLELVRSVFRDFFRRGAIEPELVEPLAHMLYGALHEMALAIAEEDDPAAAREGFRDAAQWVMNALLRQSRVDEPQ
jgi:AcrR family transcriptional regulator